jgi:SAM-dependent methyltransferase
MNNSIHFNYLDLDYNQSEYIKNIKKIVNKCHDWIKLIDYNNCNYSLSDNEYDCLCNNLYNIYETDYIYILIYLIKHLNNNLEYLEFGCAYGKNIYLLYNYINTFFEKKINITAVEQYQLSNLLNKYINNNFKYYRNDIRKINLDSDMMNKKYNIMISDWITNTTDFERETNIIKNIDFYNDFIILYPNVYNIEYYNHVHKIFDHLKKKYNIGIYITKAKNFFYDKYNYKFVCIITSIKLTFDENIKHNLIKCIDTNNLLCGNLIANIDTNLIWNNDNIILSYKNIIDFIEKNIYCKNIIKYEQFSYNDIIENIISINIDYILIINNFDNKYYSYITNLIKLLNLDINENVIVLNNDNIRICIISDINLLPYFLEKEKLEDYQIRNLHEVTAVSKKYFKNINLLDVLDIGYTDKQIIEYSKYYNYIKGVNIDSRFNINKYKNVITNVDVENIDLTLNNNYKRINNKFDYIFSINTMEHISNIDCILDAMKYLINDDGYIYLDWFDIWSGSEGHHIHNDMIRWWEDILDVPNNQRIYDRELKDIPDWSHLLWNKDEMYNHLNKKIKHEPLLNKIIKFIYVDDDINRIYYSDIKKLIYEKFKIIRIIERKENIPNHILTKLNEKYPSKSFGIYGANYILQNKKL